MSQFSGVYRAKALSRTGNSVTVAVPQVFGDIHIVVTEFTGDPPSGTEMGWVSFQSGDPEYPVWHSKVVTPPDPITPLTDHGALSGLGDNDHPQYTTDAEAASIAGVLLGTHEGAADPHTQYMTQAESDARYAPTAGGVAVGSLHDFPKLPVPAGYLYCDGTVYNISTYPALGAYLSNTFGGDGTTTFGVPNYKGMVAVCLDAAQTEFDTAGESGGAKTVTLAYGEIPTHQHTDGFTLPNHVHPMAHTHDTTVGAFVTNPGSGGIGTSAAGTAFKTATTTDQPSAANTTNPTTLPAINGTVTGVSNAGNTGAGVSGTDYAKPHNNLQPYKVVIRAIKT